MKEQEAKEKREAEYRARENRKRSGRIAVEMIEQEQARLEKIKQEKWESEKIERRRGVDYHERQRSSLDVFTVAIERKNGQTGWFARGCVCRAKRQRETQSGVKQTKT